ncbi:MAG: tryptophan--tRNA ligase [Sedimentibacter sp.]
MMENKKVIFSGMQPSGSLTLGNYLGALKNWVQLQNEYDCYYCVVDMHAITVPKEPKELRKNTFELLASYIAGGIDPEQSTLFIQSHVSAHAELGWILNCMTYFGELGRMTQFKDKSKKLDSNAITAGLFTYPVLMVADILLYQADLVPVGEDQRQHLEITRDIAQRFNNRFSETFKVPDAFIAKEGAKIMSLQEPLSKMSKSDSNDNAYIILTDDADTIRRKLKRAVTDSEGVVRYTDDQPGVKNLINIYSKISGKTTDEIVASYEGKGYAQFKDDVAEVIIGEFKPIQEKIDYLLKNKDYLEQIYIHGAEKAEAVARKTLRKVQKKVGFIPRY